MLRFPMCSVRVVRLNCSMYSTRIKRDPYQVLGVPRDADLVIVRRAYFALAKKLHPDANPDANTKEAFMEVGDAYAKVKENLASKAEQPEVAKAQDAPYKESTLGRAIRTVSHALFGSEEDDIHDLVKEHKFAEALEKFWALECEPSMGTYGLLITYCSMRMAVCPSPEEMDHYSLEMQTMAEILLEDLQRRGMEVDIYIALAMLRIHSKSGLFDHARVTYMDMFSDSRLLPNNQVVNGFMQICGDVGEHKAAIETFSHFDRVKVRDFRGYHRPNDITYSIAMHTAVSGQLTEELPMLLKSMKDNRVLPAPGTCDTLVLACVEQGKLTTAKEILKIASVHKYPVSEKAKTAALEAAAATKGLEG